MLCGGFETLDLVEIRDDKGNILERALPSEIEYDSQNRPITSPDKFIVLNKDDGNEKVFSLNWVFSEEGINFSNETKSITIKYLVYGAPNYFEDYDMLYWNAVFDDRDVIVEKARVTINYPGPVDTSSMSMFVPGHGDDYQVETANNSSKVIITKDNLLPGEGLTILQEMPKGMIEEYATLNLKLNPEEQNLTIDDLTNFEGVRERISGIPSGCLLYTSRCV